MFKWSLAGVVGGDELTVAPNSFSLTAMANLSVMVCARDRLICTEAEFWAEESIEAVDELV